MKSSRFLRASILLPLLFGTQTLLASEEEIKAELNRLKNEVDRLKTALVAQQVELIALRNGSAAGPGTPTTTPATGGSSNTGSSIDPKGKEWCDKSHLNVRACYTCAAKFAFESQGFNDCVGAIH